MADVVNQRALGYWETVCELGQRRSRGSGRIHGVARITGPLDTAMLEKALRWFRSRHPFLRAVIGEASSGFSFSFYDDVLEPVPLEVCIQSGVAWSTFLDQRLSESFDDYSDDGPKGTRSWPWRMFVLADSEDALEHHLILVMSHSIGDGACISIMFHELLSYCGVLADTLNPPDARRTLPILLPAEKLLPRAPAEDRLDTQDKTEEQISDQVLKILKKVPGAGLVKKLMPTPTPTTLSFDCDGPCPPLEDRVNGNIFRVVGGKGSARILAAVAQNNTTVNGLFSAALLKAIYDKRDPDIAVTVAVDLRKHARGEHLSGVALEDAHFPGQSHQDRYLDEAMGCYAVPVGHSGFPGFWFYTYQRFLAKLKLKGHEVIWRLAASCQEELEVELMTMKNVGFLPETFDPAELEAQIGQMREHNNNSGKFAGGPALSNLGVLPFGQSYGRLRLEHLFFGTTQNDGFLYLPLHVLTLGGKLFFCFTFAEPLISQETAGKVVDTFFHLLEEACGELGVMDPTLT